jgi:hypothetical protein
MMSSNVFVKKIIIFSISQASFVFSFYHCLDNALFHLIRCWMVIIHSIIIILLIRNFSCFASTRENSKWWIKSLIKVAISITLLSWVLKRFGITSIWNIRMHLTGL